MILFSPFLKSSLKNPNFSLLLPLLPDSSTFLSPRSTASPFLLNYPFPFYPLNPHLFPFLFLMWEILSLGCCGICLDAVSELNLCFEHLKSTSKKMWQNASVNQWCNIAGIEAQRKKDLCKYFHIDFYFLYSSGIYIIFLFSNQAFSIGHFHFY